MVDRRRLAQIVTAGCLILITVLSLTPKALMVRTGAPGDLEHAVAYGITGVSLGFAWARPALLSPWLLLTAFAVLMEIGQTFSPGRTPAAIDAAASSAGALLGLMICAWMRRREARLVD
jgi:VanZ family protein